jgi:hypothetical protein
LLKFNRHTKCLAKCCIQARATGSPNENGTGARSSFLISAGHSTPSVCHEGRGLGKTARIGLLIKLHFRLQTQFAP